MNSTSSRYTWRRIAAIAGIAAAAVGAPAWAEVNVTASAANLRYTLIDLDPNDGIAPSVDFVLPQRFLLSDSLLVNRLGRGTIDLSGDPVVSTPTTVVRDPAAHVSTWIGYDGQGVQTGVSISPYAVWEARFSQWARPDGSNGFTLSPHTGIAFSVDAAVDLSATDAPSDTRVSGDAGLELSYWTGPEQGWVGIADRVSGSVGKNAWNEFITESRQSKMAVVTWNNDSDAWGQGDIYYYASASGVVTAVPEPGEWAMLGVGLGLLGWRARRKNAAA